MAIVRVKTYVGERCGNESVIGGDRELMWSSDCLEEAENALIGGGEGADPD